MGLLDRIERRASPENPSTSLADPDAWFWDAMGARPATSGVRVSPRNVCRLSTVLACVRILSESVAQLPFIVYKRLPKGKDRAPEHPLASILALEPNLVQTSFEFRETLQAHLLLWGNAYAEIERVGDSPSGRVVGLWPLVPDRVATKQGEDGRPYYLVLYPGASIPVRFEWWQMVHLRAMSLGGLEGRAIIDHIRDAIGLGLAAEEFGARLFSNGLHPHGVLTTEQVLSDPSFARLQAQKESIHGGGPRNAHRIAILEAGVKWQQLATDPEKAQSLETRLFQVRDVARAFRVPLHMVQDLEKGASNASVEAQQNEFVVRALQPWLCRWEQRTSVSLFSPVDRKAYFAEFLVDALVRGDIETRWKAYTAAIQNGAMTRNEVRARENMNPLDGLDEPLTPLNMGVIRNGQVVPLDDSDTRRLIASLVEDRKALPPAPEDPHVELRRREQRSVDGRIRIQRSAIASLVRAAERFVGREVKAVLRAIKAAFATGDPMAAIQAELAAFYAGDFPDAVHREMLPIVLGLAGLVRGEIAEEVGGSADMHPHLETVSGEYVDVYVQRHVGSSQGQLAELAAGAASVELAREALEARVAEWDEKRPGKIASRESVRAVGFLSRESYDLAGITRLRWRTVGEDCPLCSRMDGRVVGIRQPFLESGDEVDPDDDVTTPLVAPTAIYHAPLHDGCDCQVVAEVA